MLPLLRKRPREEHLEKPPLLPQAGGPEGHHGPLQTRNLWEGDPEGGPLYPFALEPQGPLRL